MEPHTVFRPVGSALSLKPSRCVTSVGTAYVTSFVCAECVKCEILALLVEIISADNRSISSGGIISTGHCSHTVVALDEIKRAEPTGRCNDNKVGLSDTVKAVLALS